MTDVLNSALPPEAASTAIVSYNLHGLQQGVPLLQVMCDELAFSAIFIRVGHERICLVPSTFNSNVMLL